MSIGNFSPSPGRDIVPLLKKVYTGVKGDIGVHQDGLVHVSQITNRYIRHPSEMLSVGDIVEVTVLSVDQEKKRISLTMREQERSQPQKAEESVSQRV